MKLFLKNTGKFPNKMNYILYEILTLSPLHFDNLQKVRRILLADVLLFEAPVFGRGALDGDLDRVVAVLAVENVSCCDIVIIEKVSHIPLPIGNKKGALYTERLFYLIVIECFISRCKNA